MTNIPALIEQLLTARCNCCLTNQLLLQEAAQALEEAHAIWPQGADDRLCVDTGRGGDPAVDLAHVHAAMLPVPELIASLREPLANVAPIRLEAQRKAAADQLERLSAPIDIGRLRADMDDLITHHRRMPSERARDVLKRARMLICGPTMTQFEVPR